MDLQELMNYSKKPPLYDKGNSIMWTDEYISKQLLDIHLNPELDLASRSRQSLDTLSQVDFGGTRPIWPQSMGFIIQMRMSSFSNISSLTRLKRSRPIDSGHIILKTLTLLKL